MIDAEVKPPFIVVLLFIFLEYLEAMDAVNEDGVMGGVHRRIDG